MYFQAKAEAYLRIEQILERAETHFGYPCPPGAVHRAWFVHEVFWGQAGARISEMNDLGWKISSIELPKSQHVRGIKTAYRLDSKPLQAAAAIPESDYMRLRREEREKAAPLFAEAQK